VPWYSVFTGLKEPASMNAKLIHPDEYLLLSAAIDSETYTHETVGFNPATKEYAHRTVNVNTGIFSAGLYSSDIRTVLQVCNSVAMFVRA